MKKALIITYYWPPAGGTGVQRCLRFVKYLRNFGWEPVVYTADNPNYPLYDENLVKAIPEGIQTLKLKIKEPNNLFARATTAGKAGKAKVQSNMEGKKSLFVKFMWFVRGNFFIPDARVFWVKPSARYLERYLAENKVDLIFSSGPPHSLHLIAKQLKDKLNIPTVADFRDPWTTIDYLSEMFLTPFAKKKHEKLEKLVVTSASAVTVVGRTMYNEFKEKYNRESVVIYNSYEATPPPKGGILNPPSEGTEASLDKKFTLVHIGSFLKNRNCDDLWEVLSEMVNEDSVFAKNLEIKLIGNVASNVLDSIQKNKLSANLNKIDFMPYSDTLRHLYSAQVLLLPIDRIKNCEFVLTGKLFDYLKAHRPILLIGPENGDAAQVIQDCNAGYSCNFGDKAKMKNTVKHIYTLYLSGKNNIQPVNVERYSAYETTKQLARLFDSLIIEKPAQP